MRLLADYEYANRQGRASRHPNLKVALDELNAWIADPRRYDPAHHKHAWQSLAKELVALIGTRGKSLRNATPALDDLLRSLSDPTLPTDHVLQLACQPVAQLGEQELRDPRAAVAAFDDVYNTVRDASASTDKLRNRMQALQATLQTADRSLEVEGRLLASILDDAAMWIASARFYLDGTPIPDGGHWDDEAGLTAEERLDPCRRLLSTPPQAGSQVVWFAYGNARVTTGWTIAFGPVSFFDGPELLEAIRRAGEDPDWASNSHLELPGELLADDDARSISGPTSVWPTEVEHWVAVRVELEHGKPYADPVSAARDQADVLVRPASFHSGGTSWQPYSGHRHYIDAEFRSGSYPIGPELDYSLETDHTDEQLEGFRSELANHLPVHDSQLHELLLAAGVLDGSSTGNDPSALLHDVRIIELLASRSGTSNWQYQLTSTFAVRWAHRQILQELYSSVAGALHDLIVQDPNIPKRQDLLTLAPGSTDRYVRRYDTCLSALPGLATGAPAHHRATRRVRTVHRRLRNNAALARWVTELVSEYDRLVARLSRCRNSLAHGGPVDLRVAATVRSFGNTQAKLATSIGLWAVVAGDSVEVAFRQHKQERDDWRAAISSRATVADALLPPSR